MPDGLPSATAAALRETMRAKGPRGASRGANGVEANNGRGGTSHYASNGVETQNLDPNWLPIASLIRGILERLLPEDPP